MKDIFATVPQVVALPDALPNTGQSDLFTASEVLRLSGSLEPAEQGRIADHVRAAVKDQQQQIVSAQLQHSLADLIVAQRQIFFRNPLSAELTDSADVIAAAAAAEGGLKFRGGVIQLVSSGVFHANGTANSNVRIPNSMVDFINNEFSLLLSELSQENQSLLGQCRVSIESPDPTRVIWLSSADQVSRYCRYTVTMTPLLARAVFAWVVRDSWLLWLDHGNRTLLDLNDAGRVVLKHFAQEIHFILAHEIAHLVTQRFQMLVASDEICCDWGAVILTTSLDNGLNLGAFKSVLTRALEEGKGSLWTVEGTEQTQEILARLAGMQEGLGSRKSPPSGCDFHVSDFSDSVRSKAKLISEGP